MTGAQLVVAALKQQGIKTVFGYLVALSCQFMMRCMTEVLSTSSAAMNKVRPWPRLVWRAQRRKWRCAWPHLARRHQLGDRFGGCLS